MRKVFADTGYWIALLNPDDDLHQKARNLTISLENVPIVTSEMIFTELLNAFSGKGAFYRQKVVNFINHSFFTATANCNPSLSSKTIKA